MWFWQEDGLEGQGVGCYLGGILERQHQNLPCITWICLVPNFINQHIQPNITISAFASYSHLRFIINLTRISMWDFLFIFDRHQTLKLLFQYAKYARPRVSPTGYLSRHPPCQVPDLCCLGWPLGCCSAGPFADVPVGSAYRHIFVVYRIT